MADQVKANAQLTITRRDDTIGGSHLANVRSRYFLRGEHTGGAFSMVEALHQPGSQGTPLHVHTREEETIYVIEGQTQVEVDGQPFVLGPGDSIVLPRNIKHRITPAPDKVTRVLMIVTPPGLEGMLMRLDEAGQGKLDMEALAQLSKEYGVELLPDE